MNASDLSARASALTRRIRGSHHIAILKTASLVAIISAVVKLVTVARDISSASAFGRSDMMDGYVLAYTAPMAVVSLLALPVRAALVPTFVDVWERKCPRAAKDLFSNVSLAAGLMLGGMCLLLAAGGKYLLPHIATGFSGQKIAFTLKLYYILLPIIFFSGLSTAWNAVLNARGRFGWPTFMGVISPALGAVAIYLFGHRFGTSALALATTAGTAAELCAVGCLLRSEGFSLKPRWMGMSPEFRTVVGQWWPVIAAGIFDAGIKFVDQSMASMLSAGSATALSYGAKITTFGCAMIAIPLSTTVMPYFSKLAATDNYKRARRSLVLYSIGLIALTTPVVVVLMYFSPLITRMVYQRGAFTAADTVVVARVQVMYAIQIPFYLVGLILVRFLSSMKRNDLFVYCGVLNLTLDIGLNLAFMRVWGVAGIALSTSGFYIAACLYLAIASSRVLKKASEDKARKAVAT